MPDCSLVEITKSGVFCPESFGGIAAVYTIPCNKVTTITAIAGVVTAVTTAGNQGATYEPDDDEPKAKWSQTPQRTGNSVKYDQEIILHFDGIDQAKTTAIGKLGMCCCQVTFVKTNNDTIFVVGVDVPPGGDTAEIVKRKQLKADPATDTDVAENKDGIDVTWKGQTKYPAPTTSLDWAAVTAL